MMKKPICGWCGQFVEGACAIDPRGTGDDVEPRVCHAECAVKFKAVLDKQREQAVTQVLKACKRVRDAYYDFGPVDDGRPEGDEFEAALDELIGAAIAAGVKMTDKKRRRKRKAK